MKNETDFKRWVKEHKPDHVWWWNLPTQAGRAGITLPFDSECCVNGIFVAIEFKWERMDIKAHQALELGKVEHAGGLGLLICGYRSQDGAPVRARFVPYPYTDRCYEWVPLEKVWSTILAKVAKKALTG